MTIEDLDARLAAIESEIDAPEADLDALTEEVRAIKAEKETRKQAEDKRKEIRSAVAAGAGIVIEEAPAPIQEERKMFKVDSIEYRDAWTRKVCNLDMSEEERSALASAGAVIPTMTVNAVWDRLIKPAELLSKVDVSQFPSYVRFPKATTVNAASAQAVSTTISESSDVIGYVDLVPNEYVKLITVKADIEHMAIGAVHDWLVTNITESIRYAINKDILVGTGSNALKGGIQSHIQLRSRCIDDR